MFLFQDNTKASYAPVINQDDIFAHLLYQSNKQICDSEYSLTDILNEVEDEETGAIRVFEVSNAGFFALWTACCETSTSNSPEQALNVIQEGIQRRKKTPIITCFSSRKGSVKDAEAKRCVTVVLAKCGEDTLKELGLPTNERENITQQMYWVKRTSICEYLLRPARAILASTISRTNHCLQLAAIIFIATLLAGVVLFSRSNHSSDKYHTWIRYDTHGTIGPRYQLQFTHHNVSEWAARNPHQNGEYKLRIDDQAMVPAHLWDEEEEHYQEWYRNRYPEMNNVRTNQLYINETWLSDPFAIQVPSDMTFHMSHCVRALRRYWKARETGQHICPRDTDYRHVKHCLDALDEWAFPQGKRMENEGMEEVKNWVLIWETKVCFD
jgi:hypothetical protein